MVTSLPSLSVDVAVQETVVVPLLKTTPSKVDEPEPVVTPVSSYVNVVSDDDVVVTSNPVPEIVYVQTPEFVENVSLPLQVTDGGSSLLIVIIVVHVDVLLAVELST